MVNILKNNYWLWILLAIFVVTRFFGLGQLIHQDEYRWVSIANTAEFGELDSPHPPVMENLFALGGKLFGYDNLRTVPFIFGILSLLLIYTVSRRLTGNKKIAYLAVGLFVVNVYSLVANLMIDIDGAVLPFVVLLTYYFYLRFMDIPHLSENSAVSRPFRRINTLWKGAGLVAVMTVGFLTKLSFVLFLGALAADHLWTLYEKGSLKSEIKNTGLKFGAIVLFALGLYLVYGANDPLFAKYSTHFKIFNFSSRAYFELFLRLFKFFMWYSPLLFLPAVYGLFKKDIFAKYRIWYIYSLFNFIFYFVIFDFARLPIERYFMFIIAPSALISAEVIYSFLPKFNKKYLMLGLAAFALLLIFVSSINYEVIPLNPKEAYVNKIKDLDFNFLVPLTGGSGPIGFYIPAQFILWAWLACSLWLLSRIFSTEKLWSFTFCIFIVFGLGYNILFLSENLTGALYGSVNNITKRSVDYVINNPEIDKVITYYDAGVYYLKIADKYEARFYTAPSRNYDERLTAYRGHYLIVDFPAVGKKHKYWQMISRCDLDKKFTDKYVESYIFDCRSLPPAL